VRLDAVLVPIALAIEPVTLVMLAGTFDRPQESAAVLIVGAISWLRAIAYVCMRVHAKRLERWHQ